MEPTPALDFLAELDERLRAVDPASSLFSRLEALSKAEDSFLFLDDGQIAGTLPAIAKRFAQSWPEDQPLNSKQGISLVQRSRERDPALQKWSDRLVPKKTSERRFWRHYFSRVHAVLASEAPSIKDQLACHLDGLPKARPVEARRFPAAADLQTSGEIPRANLLEFVSECSRMVSSEESLTNVAMAVADDGADVSLAMLHLQLEFMESKGYERTFGTLAMSPAGRRNTESDPELDEALQKFQQLCSDVGRMALQQAQMRAARDPSKRRLQPAGSLQEDGELSAERLLEVLDAIEAHTNGPELRGLLVEDMKAGGHPQMTAMRLQRELLESLGIQQDFGMRQLRSLHARGAQAGEGSAEALGAEKLKALNAKMQATTQEVMVDVNKPTLKPAAERRFKPADADGGPTLQKEGQLSRDQVLKFCQDVKRLLMDDESQTRLADLDEQEGGQLSISWQREYLEHMGVDQDFGCRQLAQVPARFGGDQEVMRAFQAFQTACRLSMERAKMQRSVQLKSPAERRFQPAEGDLQAQGDVDRHKVLRYLRDVPKLLLDDDTVRMLSGTSQYKVGSRLIEWQLEYFEHIGIKAEHGRSQLAAVPQRFKDDREVTEAFAGFQRSCVEAMRKVMLLNKQQMQQAAQQLQVTKG